MLAKAVRRAASVVRPDLVMLDAEMSPAHLLLYDAGFRVAFYSITLSFSRFHTNGPAPPLGSTVVPGTLLWRLRSRLAWRANTRGRFPPPAFIPLTFAIWRSYADAGCDPKAGFTELVLCPREFDLPQTRLSRGAVYVGPSIDLDRPPGSPVPWHRLEGSGPLVYAALGTMTASFPERARQVRRGILEAVSARPDWRVLLVGEVEGPVPPHVVVVPSAPQLEVLARADVMVTHAGLNSVKECIFFGVPMVALPLGYDQPGNSARIEFHRLGRMGPIKHCSGTSVRSLIDQVLSTPSFKSNVARMRDAFRRAEQDAPSIQIIDQLLAGQLTNPDSQAASVWRAQVAPRLTPYLLPSL
jgi:UDP:flavonoid glycosyltransferase YjiC (YdhE family)